MNKRMVILLSTVGVLGSLYVLDRFVLNPDGQDNLAAPVARVERQRAAPIDDKQISKVLFLEPLAKFDEIWQRPIFVPSREPAAITATPNAPGQDALSSDQPPKINIIGVAIGPTNSAVMVRTDRRTINRYFTGEQINGWTVEEIKVDTVTVKRNGDRWQLPVGASN
ncbi:MAG: hypothetical protein COA85_08675 [Robiginitomaculum sp.]|nr:MAG: hypothetical protein COA85_08675 [Robiginitomaculum sp.]